MKQDECLCPLSWSVHCNFVRDGNYSEKGWACIPPPPHPHQLGTNFSIMMECTPESGGSHLCVYSVTYKIKNPDSVQGASMFDFAKANKGRVRTRQAGRAICECWVDIKKYTFGVRVVEKIKLHKNIQHVKNLLECILTSRNSRNGST